VNNAPKPAGRLGALPPQENIERATEMGFAALCSQQDEQMVWLGAHPEGNTWRVPALNDTFVVDLSQRRVTTSEGHQVGVCWRILALHYLAISARPAQQVPETTFAELPTARSYASVYQGRVIARLCATAGRNAQRLKAAAAAVGGRAVDAEGDAAFDFDVFPRLLLRLIWHAPDEEFPSSATLLLPSNIESYFCSEDIVVLSESLVARLGGRPF